MHLDLKNLPSDIDLLHRLVRDMASVVETRNDEIERLQRLIKAFRRGQFGRRSERLDPDQLALGLEDLDADLARMESRQSPPSAKDEETGPGGRPTLGDHLPRDEVICDVGHEQCPDCGSALHEVGESVSEMLDWVPAQLRVLRIRRPKYGCRACDTIHQAPAPERPIAKGMATSGLLAQVLVSKYCDHTPLYRQAQIFARNGARIERSTLAGWVGGACWWLEPLQARLAAHVFASTKLFADDTPLPVLDPGRGRTKTGRLSRLCEGLEIGIRTAHLADIPRSGEEIGAREPMALPDQPVLVLTIAARLKRTGMEKKLLIEGANERSGTKADAGLLKLIARAHELQEIFTRGGRPISEMANEAGVSSSHFTRTLRLSFIAPDITRAILHGRQPADLTARSLVRYAHVPIDWDEQRSQFGFV